jgi:alkanesulfonate monooxygenase SsuD/methylene tetrahydromethanopterin reductase-like flavin-dependent oxidoreductase (luciferase family)
VVRFKRLSDNRSKSGDLNCFLMRASQIPPRFGLTLRETSEHPLREIALFGEKLGYDAIGPAEGHYLKYRVSSGITYLRPIVILSYISAITRKIDLLFHSLLVTLNHPFHLATEIGSLQTLSGGRVILTAAAGWLEEEFDAFQIPMSERFPRLVETVDVLKRLWTEKNVSYDGKFYKFNNVTLGECARPTKRIPIWLCGDTPRAIRRAVRIGDSWYGGLSTFEQMKERCSYFAAELQTHGRSLENTIVPMPRLVAIAKTNDEAENFVQNSIKSWIAASEGGKRLDVNNELTSVMTSLVSRSERNISKIFEPKDITFENLRKNIILVGGPDQIIEQMEDYRELGVNFFMLHFVFENPTQLFSQMEIFAKQVIPKVKAS